MNKPTLNLKRVMFGAVLMTLLVSSSVSFAMPFGGEGDEHQEKYEEQHRQMMDKILGEINLTEEQLAKIDAQREQRKENKKNIRQQMMEHHKALQEALDSPQTDRALIEERIQKMSDLMTQGMRARVNTILSMKEILTPEQFAQLRAKKQAMKKEFWKNKKKDWQRESKDESSLLKKKAVADSSKIV